MVFARLKAWWQPQPPVTEREWRQAAGALPVLGGLSAEEHARLGALAQRFLREKSIEPVGGLALEQSMRLSIALQACLPILNLGLDYYRNWYSVVIYPAGFVARHEYMAEDGTIHVDSEPMVGEAWEQGPVVLSWEDIATGCELDGFNVIVHEFAHKLDMLQGSINGLPPLHRNMSAQAWSGAFAAAYKDFCARVDAGEELPLDDYAAESPAEFFAVLSEAFFEIPSQLHYCYPQVYRQLSLFYRQDPMPRLPVAG